MKQLPAVILLRLAKDNDELAEAISRTWNTANSAQMRYAGLLEVRELIKDVPGPHGYACRVFVSNLIERLHPLNQAFSVLRWSEHHDHEYYREHHWN